RVDRQTMAAHSWAGRERHEPERLRGSGTDRSPDVDAEVAGKHGQLVHEGDVDMAERVLEQLGELRLSGRSDRYGAVDERVIKALDRCERGLVDTRHDLRGVDEVPLRVSRINSLGAVAEEEVISRRQARRLEDGRNELLGRPRIGRGLEHNGRPLTEIAGECACRVIDVA